MARINGIWISWRERRIKPREYKSGTGNANNGEVIFHTPLSLTSLAVLFSSLSHVVIWSSAVGCLGCDSTFFECVSSPTCRLTAHASRAAFP